MHPPLWEDILRRIDLKYNNIPSPFFIQSWSFVTSFLKMYCVWRAQLVSWRARSWSFSCANTPALPHIRGIPHILPRCPHHSVVNMWGKGWWDGSLMIQVWWEVVDGTGVEIFTAKRLFTMSNNTSVPSCGFLYVRNDEAEVKTNVNVFRSFVPYKVQWPLGHECILKLWIKRNLFSKFLTDSHNKKLCKGEIPFKRCETGSVHCKCEQFRLWSHSQILHRLAFLHHMTFWYL